MHTRCPQCTEVSQALGVGVTREDHGGSLGQVIRADGDLGKWLWLILLLSFPSTLHLHQLLTFVCWVGVFFCLVGGFLVVFFFFFSFQRNDF